MAGERTMGLDRSVVLLVLGGLVLLALLTTVLRMRHQPMVVPVADGAGRAREVAVSAEWHWPGEQRLALAEALAQGVVHGQMVEVSQTVLLRQRVMPQDDMATAETRPRILAAGQRTLLLAGGAETDRMAGRRTVRVSAPAQVWQAEAWPMQLTGRAQQRGATETRLELVSDWRLVDGRGGGWQRVRSSAAVPVARMLHVVPLA